MNCLLLTKSAGLFAGCLLAGAACAAEENVVWVDCRSTAASPDGSESAPYPTLQAGVNKAKEGWTVRVKPGVYDRFHWHEDGNASISNCVCIAKKNLRLESTDGAAVTHVVGRHAQTAKGIGDDAVRCVTVSATGVVIKGFTFRDGASRAINDEGNVGANFSGAVYGYDSQPRTVLVDCVVSNCIATRGGAVAYLDAIRSQFYANYTVGGRHGSCGRRCNFYACILSGNGNDVANTYSAPILFESGGEQSHVSQCTIVGSASVGLCATGVGDVANTVGIFNHGASGGERVSFQASPSVAVAMTNCVWDFVSAAAQENFVNTSVLGGNAYVLASPFEGDFRPVAGSVCDGGGDPSAAAPGWVPEEFRGKDVFGNPFVRDGRCNVGAVAASVEMKGGFELFYTDSTNGAPPQIAGVRPNPYVRDKNVRYYVGAVEGPRQVYATVTPPAGKTFLRFVISGCGGSHGLFKRDADIPMRYPDYAANGAHFWLPPAGTVLTNRAVFAEAVRYVSPNGSDANGGTSAQDAYGTLQFAVDNAPDNSVVYALPGVYRTGGAFAGSNTNRVAISRSLLLKAFDPTQETVIEGVNNGYDPTSVRCATISGCQAAIQGFTLRGGAVVGTDNNAADWGAGFYGESQCSELVDCVVEYCQTKRGAAVYGGWTQRCVFRNNTCDMQGVTRASYDSSCIFYDNVWNGQYAVTGGGYAFDCSCYESAASGKLLVSSEANCYNSIFVGGSGWNQGTNVEKLGGFSDYNSGNGWTKSGVLFANPAEGDFRLRSDSPAIGGGVSAPQVKNDMLFVFFGIGGFNCEPTLLVDGKPTAGAVQKTVPVVNVGETLAGDITPAGVRIVEPGTTLTLTAGHEKRNFIGVTVDGVFHAASGRTFDYVAPLDCVTAPVSIAAVYATNWYVNADAAVGSDSNDGWTPQTPRRTLAAALADVVSGDVVHAAPGRYDDGSVKAQGNNATLSRASVPSGVTLSGEDRATTFIVGAGAPNQKADDVEGIGEGATRCVFLAANATVCGFTLVGGRTHNEGNVDSSFGGGVRGADAKTSVVRDCFVTNCCAARGGGGYQVKFENCRLVGNVAATGANGAAGRDCSFFGCYIGGHQGPGSTVFYPHDIVNCTYAADNSNNIGTPPEGAAGRLVNTLVLGTQSHGRQKAATNVVYVAGASVSATEACNLQAKPLEDIKVDSAGRPLPGSCLIDAGDNVAASELGPRDADGGQRVFNGTVDIGACEFDWRPVYAATLNGEAACTVTEASPEVRNADGKVLVNGTLATTLAGATTTTVKYAVPISVTGDGSLEVFLNGESVGSYVRADGAKTLAFKNRLAANALSFVYVPTADDVGCAEIGEIERNFRGLMLIVR